MPRLCLLSLLVSAAAIGCGQGNSETTSSDEYERQIEVFDRQTARGDKLLDEQDEQTERFGVLLNKWEEQAQRQDAILAAQEKQLGIDKK